jgi:hypothetical protein
MGYLSPFDAEAVRLLKANHVQPVTSDVVLLADDLQCIADQEWPNESDDITAKAASALLMRRVSPASLERYMKCLRIQRAQPGRK